MLNLNPLSETKLHTYNPNQLQEMHTDCCLFSLGRLILWHALKMLYLSLTNTANWNLGTILFTIQVLNIWFLHQNFHLTLLLNNWMSQLNVQLHCNFFWYGITKTYVRSVLPCWTLFLNLSFYAVRNWTFQLFYTIHTVRVTVERKSKNKNLPSSVIHK